MIAEDYVGFEVAKLLKEKGFDGKCEAMYDKDGHFVPFNFKVLTKADKRLFVADAPTLQMAMKWLRIEHNIHIEILMTNHSMSERFDIPKYYWVAVNAKTCKWISESTVYSAKQFDTNEEACEAAIKYCLENLMNK